jgi:glycosyltransferase involved in cell wall biosynthesis
MEDKPVVGRKDALIVLGMHRSGTSALSRALSLAGAQLPSGLMGGGLGNPDGHWEPTEVAALNDRIFEELDSGWNDTFGPRELRQRKLPTDKYLPEARDIIRRNYADANFIVLKEPRTCIFVDLWREALRLENYNSSYILAVRHPTEVAASLKSRDGFDRNKSFLLWATYMLSAEYGTRDCSRIFIKYEDLLLNTESIFNRMESELDILFPRRTWDSTSEIQEFLTTDKRHHAATQLPSGVTGFAEIQRLYSFFDAASRGDPQDSRIPDEVSAWLSNLEHIAGPIVKQAERDLRATESRLQSERQAASLIQRNLESELSLAQANLSSADASFNARLARLTEEAESAARRVADLETALAAARDRIGAFETAGDGASVIQADNARKALAEAVEKEMAAKASLAEAQSQIGDLSAAREAAEAKQIALEAQLADQAGDLVRTRAVLANSSSQLAETQTHLFSRTSERDRLNAELGDARGELEVQRGAILERETVIADRDELLRVQAEHLLRLHDEAAFLMEHHQVLGQEKLQLSTELSEARRAEYELRTEIGALMASIREYKTSTSWLVTRPLRWLGRLWGRLRQGGRGESRGDEGGIQSIMSNDIKPGAARTQPDVLFIIGCWEGESKRYRVYNLIEGLTNWGYTADSVDFGQCGVIIERKILPKVAVFFRAPFDPSSSATAVLEYFRQNGVHTVFDVDDYVFEPKIIDTIAGVAALGPQGRRDYEWGVRAYRSMLFCCDSATVTTRYLAERMEKLGRDVAVVPNTVNAAQKQRASQILSSPREVGDTVRICYFSGSKTHARDFQEAEAAVQAILRKNRNVIFRLVGLLDLDSSWDAFAERIERSGLIAPLDMLDSLAECSINLAPLEEDNAFCEGKSELKFFEAALVQVPTVASRTVTYADAIRDGIDGYLASGSQEWEAKLQALVDSAALRHNVGVAARDVAHSRFNTDAAVQRALIAYGLEQPDTLERVERKDALKIGWIVPGLIVGSGGHRNILRAAYHLERFGHDVRLYFSDTMMNEGELRRSVREHFYPFRGPISRFEGQVADEDVLMATHWSTVALAESVKSRVGEIMYFVQDFEPAFYPMGSEYLLAENTYRKSLYGISSGPWCERLLRERYGMEVDHFRFPIDRVIYNSDNPQVRANRVLFFAKPEMPRRCFLIGVSALSALHKLRPDVEIMFYGSSSAQNYPLDFPVTFCGVLPGIADLAKLYATSALGVVFSTTNPSLVPYEMMATGLPVVDMGVPGNEVNYDDRFDIALLADPDPAVMARSIADLLGDPEQMAARSARGLAFTSSFPSEQQMAKRIEGLILKRFDRSNQALARTTKLAATRAEGLRQLSDAS